MPAYDEASARSLLLSCEPPYRKWNEFYRFDDRDLIQPTLIRRGASKLGLFFRPSGRSRHIWRSFSSDEGRSWSAPVWTALPNPLGGIGAFFSQGRDSVVYNPSPDNRYRLSLSHSDDAGASWSRAATLDNSDVEVSYPSFIVGMKSRVHGVYTYNRRMIKYVSFPAAWWLDDSP